MAETYEIVDDGLGIKCLVCGRTSYDLGDIDNLWCGGCKKFHEDMMVEEPKAPKQEPKSSVKAPPKPPVRSISGARKEGWRPVTIGGRSAVGMSRGVGVRTGRR